MRRFVDRDMVMRFHGGVGVGHLSYCTGGPELPHTLGDSGVPMEVDPPDVAAEGQAPDGMAGMTDSEGFSEESGAESDSSSHHIPEPDSEEDPDIYL